MPRFATGTRRHRCAPRSRRAWASVLLALLTALTACAGGSEPGSAPGATSPATDPDVVVAPYLYLGGEQPPDPATVVARTGVRWFTLGFVLSARGCEPTWAEQTGLGGEAAAVVDAVRRARGHVVVSVGGAQGDKLGVRCPDARSLAAAYQDVIDRYHPAGLDFDVEGAEFEDPRAQDRILRALRILGRDHPRLTLSVTVPVTPEGLDRHGQRLVRRAADLDAPVDVWMIMPFNFGREAAEDADDAGDAEDAEDTAMGRLAIRATERTHEQLRSVHPSQSDRAVYRQQGVVLMNGRTDTGEVVTQADFRQVRQYAARHHLARLSFWSLNRDRACRGHEGHHACSGVRQRPWEFTDALDHAHPARDSHPPGG